MWWIYFVVYRLELLLVNQTIFRIQNIVFEPNMIMITTWQEWMYCFAVTRKRVNHVLPYLPIVSKKIFVKTTKPIFCILLILFSFSYCARYDGISSIYHCNNFGIHLFTRIVKFTWKMFAVLFIWFGYWLHNNELYPIGW